MKTIKEVGRHCGTNTYVITHDLGERIKSFRLLGLRTPEADDNFYTEFNNGIQSWISSIIPEVTVSTYDMRQLVESVWTSALHLQSQIKDAIVVSTCAEMASMRRGHTLEVNRIVDMNGELIGLGPRPGNRSLISQINAIASVANGNPVVIVEDGAFTGTTLIFILKQLIQRRIKVSAVVVGMCFPGAMKKIREVFDGDVIILEEIDHPYEWMPDHDFIPFAPNCGRVYGGKFGEEVLPFYTHEGISFSFPYILPFGDPVKWASIPAEHACKFSLYCLEQASHLFGMLDAMNGRRITIRDFAGSAPRVSMPMSIGSSHLPDGDIPISEFLSEVCHELV